MAPGAGNRVAGAFCGRVEGFADIACDAGCVEGLGYDVVGVRRGSDQVGGSMQHARHGRGQVAWNGRRDIVHAGEPTRANVASRSRLPRVTMTTTVGGRRRRLLTSIVFASCCALAACSGSGNSGPPASTAAGNYATTPLIEASEKVATPREARTSEAVRLADLLLDPVEVDPAYTDNTSGRSYIAADGNKMNSVVSDKAAGMLHDRGMLAAATVERKTADGARYLALSVWEFPSSTAAQQAARTAVVDNIDGAGKPLPIAPTTVADADQASELAAQSQTIVHAVATVGPLVLWAESATRVPTAPDRAALGSFFTRQRADAAAFTPNGTADYRTVSAPTSQLQTEVVPDTYDTTLAIKNATYSRRGGLHWQDTGALAAVFAETGVSEVAIGRTNGYRTASAAQARVLADELLTTDAGDDRAVDYPVPAGLDDRGLRCRKLAPPISPTTSGPIYWCVVTVAERVFELSGNHHQDLWQQAAAQQVLARTH